MNKAILSLLFIILCLFCKSGFAQKSDVIDSLENVLKTAKEDTNKVNLLYNLAKETSKTNISEASKYAKQSLVLAQQIKWDVGIANGYHIMAYLYNQRSMVDSAIAFHIKSLAIRRKQNDKKGISNSLHSLGIIYQGMGEYEKAIELEMESMEIKKMVNDQIGIGNILNSLGNIFLLQSDYNSAIKYYFESLSIYDSLGLKKNQSTAFFNIGRVYEQMNDYSKALFYQQKSLNLKEAIDDQTGLVQSNQAIGALYYRQGDYYNSIIYYRKSLTISEEIKLSNSLAGIYNDLARSYIYLDDSSCKLLGIDFKTKFIEAENLILKSIQLHIDMKDKRGEVASKTALSELYYKSGKYHAADSLIESTLGIAKSVGALDIVRDLYLVQSTLYEEIKENSKSLNAYKKYVLYKDSIINERKNNQIAEMQTRFETEKKDKEIELLNKENELKAVQVKQQHASLLASNLETEKKENEILLLNKSNEVKGLQLAKTNNELKQQQTEVGKQTAEMALLKKEQMLKQQQLEKQKLLRNGIIIGAALLVLVAVLLFNRYQLRKKLEQQQAINSERKRISADLHDDIGSGLSKISLLSELIKKDSQEIKVLAGSEKISDTLKELSGNLSEIIWALNSKNDYLENLIAYIRRYAAEYFEDSEIALKIKTPEQVPDVAVTSEQRRNIFFVVKEALHNIVKHADATEAELNFIILDNKLTVTIHDNGIGFRTGGPNRFGNGIKNMHSRMESINGTFAMESHNGTKAVLEFPV